VNVGGLDVMAFTDMAQLVQYIVRDDGSVFAGSAIAINPEKVMKARSDAALRDMLNQAEIRYADGMGVVKVMRKKTRATGAASAWLRNLGSHHVAGGSKASAGVSGWRKT